MPEYCTCGAQLPPDARFCHKCGKPQFEELVEETSAPEPPPPIIVEPHAEAAAEIGFRNPLAVRIGLFLAIMTFLLGMVLGPFILLLMLVSGFVAVYLYRRRTGESLSVRSGARLGWITGLFMFVITLILISMIALALTDKTFVDNFLTQMRQRGAEAAARQFVEALQDPASILQGLVGAFAMCGSLPMIGGLLGARLLRGTGPRAVH